MLNWIACNCTASCGAIKYKVIVLHVVWWVIAYYEERAVLNSVEWIKLIYMHAFCLWFWWMWSECRCVMSSLFASLMQLFGLCPGLNTCSWRTHRGLSHIIPTQRDGGRLSLITMRNVFYDIFSVWFWAWLWLFLVLQ